MTRKDREAWSDFWSMSGRGPVSGCLPNALATIAQVQRQCWQEFARKLPRGGRVLDIGSGDGVVLVQMQAARSDLKLTGIDSAERLPPAPKGIKLRTGVTAEALPFGDGTIDAVVSQFGYEYSETGSAAPEVARVLRSEGRLCCIVHHREGPIVLHNAARLAGLRWAVEESGLIEKARRFVGLRGTGTMATPPLYAASIGEARNHLPQAPVAAEIAQAVWETIERSRGRAPVEPLDVLRQIERHARNEIGRIEALSSAARDQAGIDALCGQLVNRGLKMASPAPLAEEGVDAPFAWLISGTKR